MRRFRVYRRDSFGTVLHLFLPKLTPRCASRVRARIAATFGGRGHVRISQKPCGGASSRHLLPGLSRTRTRAMAWETLHVIPPRSASDARPCVCAGVHGAKCSHLVHALPVEVAGPCVRVRVRARIARGTPRMPCTRTRDGFRNCLSWLLCSAFVGTPTFPPVISGPPGSWMVSRKRHKARYC